MKKTLIFILTILTLVSVMTLSAFATESDANTPEDVPPVADGTMPAPQPGEPAPDMPEQGGKPMMPAPEAPEGEVPTIGDTDKDADAEADADSEINIKFTTDNISTSLEHMGLGMLGVVIVLGLIACVVFVLNKFFKK